MANIRGVGVTYDLALYLASGPGLGHLMRCYALAETAVEMKAKVIVAVAKPGNIKWPCTVITGIMKPTMERPGLFIVDASDAENDFEIAHRKNIWRIIDSPDAEMKGYSGAIYPHFGATPIPGYPTLYGEQWMPLRRHFRHMDDPPGRERVAGYKISAHIAEHDRSGQGTIPSIELMSQADRVIVPASTVAYEALAAGRHVQLHDNVDGLEHVRDAMLEAGVAEMWPNEKLAPGVKHLDGLGARRILEALL